MRKMIAGLTVLLLICCICFLPLRQASADVGNFNDYGGDSDWGSDWGDSGGSDFGSDWGGGSGIGIGSTDYGDSDFDPILLVVILVGVLVLGVVFKGAVPSTRSGSSGPAGLPTVTVANNTGVIVPAVRSIDPGFTAEGFIGFSKEVFITLQEAWMERDWRRIRPFEKEELYKLHEKQLEEYRRLGRINVLERINVNTAYLQQYRRDDSFEYLRVYMEVRMIDYIKDEKTGQVLKGDPNRDCYMRYLLTFTRKKGVPTKTGTDQSSVVACPHCGAPTSVTSSGQCEYCGFIVTTGEYGWVLSDMEAVRRGGAVDNTPVILRETPMKTDPVDRQN